MNNISKVIVSAVALILVVSAIILKANFKPKEKTNLDIKNVDDLTSLVDKIYDGVKIEMFNVATNELDLTDDTTIKSNTGLESGSDIEFAVTSEPLINAQAYSLVLLKVKDGVNANKIAKQMAENIDTRKWICVTAEKLYATNSGNIVFLVMTDKEKAKSVYDSFKSLAKTTGKVYERTTEEGNLPSDTEAIVEEQIQ